VVFEGLWDDGEDAFVDESCDGLLDLELVFAEEGLVVGRVCGEVAIVVLRGCSSLVGVGPRWRSEGG